MKVNLQWKLQATLMLALLGLSFSCTRQISVPVAPSFTQTTNTFTPTASPTNSPTDSPTSTNVFTSTASNTPSNTPSSTPSFTPTQTATQTPTATPTNTNPGGFTNTFTDTPSNTPTATVTNTPTDTYTFTNTNTPTDSPTNTATATPTATATNTATNTPDPLLIDNFEDNDGQVSPASGGYSGYWNSNNDGSAVISPAPASWVDASAPGNGSSYAAHVTCGPVTSYANFGFNFMNPAASVDLSAYTGIVFDVKMDGFSGSNILRVSVSDVDTDSNGGVCSACSDYHSGNVCMSTSWQSVTIFWNQLSQAGWGNPQAAFKPAQVFAVFFQFPANQPMGVWVDNIKLTTAAPPAVPGNKAISDFDYFPGATGINTNLSNYIAGNQGFTQYTGGVSVVTQMPFVQCGGYTNFGARVNSSWTQTGYDAASLTANLYNGSSYYNMTPFAGVSFMLKISQLQSTGASPPDLQFHIPLSTVVPAGNGGTGTCTSYCWDDFVAPAWTTTTGGWVAVGISFASMTRSWTPGANDLAPCSMTNLADGCNNLNVMQLQWSSQTHNVPGNYTCDYWIDNLTFY